MRLYRLEEHVESAGLCGLITALENASTFGALLAGNILAPDPPALPTRIPADTLIAWSGSLSEDGLFTREPATWMPSGLARFQSTLETLAPLLDAAGARLLFRPHARHVLADPQRCLTTLRKWRASGAPFGLVLEPAAMLEADMIPTAPDHLLRAFDALGPLADAVLLENVEPPAPPGSDPEGEPPLERVALHRGVLDPGVIAGLTAEFVPPETPIILRAEEIDAQAAVLSPGAA